jgi:hypothetical protein
VTVTLAYLNPTNSQQALTSNGVHGAKGDHAGAQEREQPRPPCRRRPVTPRGGGTQTASFCRAPAAPEPAQLPLLRRYRHGEHRHDGSQNQLNAAAAQIDPLPAVRPHHSARATRARNASEPVDFRGRANPRRWLREGWERNEALRPQRRLPNWARAGRRPRVPRAGCRRGWGRRVGPAVSDEWGCV